MRGMRCLVAIGFASYLVACDANPLSPGELRQLRLSMQRWESRGFGDYSFEWEQTCFGCEPGFIRIVVRSGDVESAARVASGEPLQPQLVENLRTIEEHFTMIGRANSEESLDNIVVDYDPTLGYPGTIRHTCHSNYLDCGSIRKIRNVLPLQ